MARLAHEMAVESARLDAEVVSVDAFPELAREHGVRSVPHVALDDGRALVGSLRPEALADALLE